jgi:hypothetical protein
MEKAESGPLRTLMSTRISSLLFPGPNCCACAWNLLMDVAKLNGTTQSSRSFRWKRVILKNHVEDPTYMFAS